ncbi:MAG: hypothetical protein MUP30_07710 [Deltaproteobacteria bacterium]|jgi:hypothetical protein|nr:hypothetical protein [Deltaproteobacteria bacterium]
MDACAYANFIPKISTISKWAQKSNEKGALFRAPSHKHNLVYHCCQTKDRREKREWDLYMLVKKRVGEIYIMNRGEQ